MSADSTPRCVLIAEDEMLLAMMLEDILQDAGFRVLKAARLLTGLELAASESIDAAILDVHLAGKEVFPLADELSRRRIPFLFASGYGDNGLPPEYQGAAMLQKPYVAEQLLEAVHRMLTPEANPP